MIEDTRLQDDGVYQCQVGATKATIGIRSSNAFLIVQGEISSIAVVDFASLHIEYSALYKPVLSTLYWTPRLNE